MGIPGEVGRIEERKREEWRIIYTSTKTIKEKIINVRKKRPECRLREL